MSGGWDTTQVVLAVLAFVLTGAIGIVIFFVKKWMDSVDERLDAIHAMADKYVPEREVRFLGIESRMASLQNEVSRIRQDLEEVLKGTRQWQRAKRACKSQTYSALNRPPVP